LKISVFRFTATIDTTPQSAANKWWRYIGCLRYFSSQVRKWGSCPLQSCSPSQCNQCDINWRTVCSGPFEKIYFKR